MNTNRDRQPLTHQLLARPRPPWIAIDVVSKARLLPEALYPLADQPNPVFRKLRGGKMRTKEALMDEFGAALQFFDGFGENWHALKECLSYLDEWLPGSCYVLVITEPSAVLSACDGEELKWLLKILAETGEWWSTPIVDNGRFNRPARPFHTVLQCSPTDLAALGKRFSEIPLLDRPANHEDS